MEILWLEKEHQHFFGSDLFFIHSTETIISFVFFCIWLKEDVDNTQITYMFSIDPKVDNIKRTLQTALYKIVYIQQSA